MIIEALAVGAVAKTFYSVNKSMKMDEKALKKYAKAFEMNEEAHLLIKQKEELADKRLKNVAKKKKAVVDYSIPKFIEVYDKIQNIEIEESKNSEFLALISNNRKVCDSMKIVIRKNFTDKDFICGMVFKGFAKMIEVDSEKFLSAANKQLSYANVVYEQSKSISEVYDAVIERANRISNLIVAMNNLFLKSIDETKKVIDENGYDVKKYSEYNKSVLMICVNLAIAMTDIINIPVVDEKGVIVKEAEKLIIVGEKYIEEVKNNINFEV